MTKEDVEKAMEFGEEYNEPPSDSGLDITTSQSNTSELFNSTIDETQMKKLIMPISSVSIYEETGGSDIPYTSIETRIESNSIDTTSVKMLADLETLNDSKNSQNPKNNQIENLDKKVRFF